MQQQLNTEKLKVIARAPFNVYYNGDAEAVTATNRIGKFDILPEHADFFSILSPGEIIIETSTSPIVFNVSNGIITVRDNEVMIFVNI
jgi:F0F1-type ATP synthase epsilon subunit